MSKVYYDVDVDTAIYGIRTKCHWTKCDNSLTTDLTV